MSDVGNIESEDNISDIFAYDTDIDPDYVPDDSIYQAGPSRCVLGNTRLILNCPVSSSSDVPRLRATVSHTKPRGRSRNIP